MRATALPSTLLASLLLCAPLAGASAPKPQDYPLRIVLLGAEQTISLARSFTGAAPAILYSGHGRGDLIDSSGVRAIDFEFGECSTRIAVNVMEPRLLGQWTQPGKQMKILIRVAKPGPPDVRTCTLQVTLQPEKVYLLQKGLLVTVSQQEYAANPSLHATIEDDPGKKRSTALLPRVTAATGDMQRGFAAIPISPISDAPFTASVVTTWIRTLPNGETLTVKNRQRIARSSSGLIFEELRAFSSEGDRAETSLQSLLYIQPAQHLQYLCSPETRVCESHPYTAPSLDAEAQAVKLGSRKIDGFDTNGTQWTSAPTPVASAPVPLVSTESWTSPQLQIALVQLRTQTSSKGSEISDSQESKIEDLQLAVPDSSLFTIPADYKVVAGH